MTARQTSTDILIVGAGFSGLYMLHKARTLGLTALVLEAAPSVGGTWYHNRYPGARVDIESLEYSFGFSDALQQAWRWTERYAAQPELLRYANHVADRFQLRDGIQLNTRMTAAVFDEADSDWHVQSADGVKYVARFLVMASGPLSAPNAPAFKGLDSFRGATYHTAQWPVEPVDFTGKHVAVVGTGSSAVQSIPVIAKQAAHVTVFQRTAAYVAPAHNGALDPVYEAHIKSDYPGFRERNRAMYAGFGSEMPPGPASALEVSAAERTAAYEERWRVGGFALLRAFNDTIRNEHANAFAAEFVRAKIRDIVVDPKRAALLSPQQTIGCKRMCVGTDYYETYNRPNVSLVDVSTDPIESITETGLRTRQTEHTFDMLVLATGFDAMTGTLMRLDIRGRGGVTIQDKWRTGPLNYLGLMVSGFPNFFNIAGPGSTSAFTNVMLSIEHHVEWIADCLVAMRANGHRTIDATAAAEADWVAYANSVAEATLFLTCNSWYLGANIPGKTRQFMPLASGYPTYVQKCADVAANGYSGCVLA